MQQSLGQRPTTSAAVLGVLLIAIGAIALVLRVLVGITFSFGEQAWPYLVIVPGLVLMGAALVPAPPRGIGFAIAGAIVTTVGGLLLYQSQSGNWESWAYAWALLPGSAGLALVAYGLLTRTAAYVREGSWLAVIAGILFIAGLWFFGGIFAGEPRPEDLDRWWPVGVMAIGALIVLRAFVFRTPAETPPAAPPSSPFPESATPR